MIQRFVIEDFSEELLAMVGEADAEFWAKESNVVAFVQEWFAEQSKDDPELDATDGAHPAWWRGHSQAVAAMCEKVNAILDGKDDGAGVSREPWDGTRRRLIGLHQAVSRTLELHDTEARLQNFERCGCETCARLRPAIAANKTIAAPTETP